MPVDFLNITPGKEYDRPELAELWGYKAFNAFGRGVFTPKDQNVIVLFITEKQQPALPQYDNLFNGDILWMDGEEGHRSDRRLAHSSASDHVHLFYRTKSHSLFQYCGELTIIESFLASGSTPSRFVFTIRPQLIIEAERAVESQIADTADFFPEAEGKRLLRLHVVYERSKLNREMAINIHGTKCLVCGFDYDKTYGADLAKSYIEVHHLRSITEIKGQTVDPKTDLAPLCANCHRMAHRNHRCIVDLDELRRRITKSRIVQLEAPL